MSITLPKLPHPVMNAMLSDDWGDLYTADQMHAHAATASAAKDAEIAQLRADLIKSLADNKALLERVRVLEDARPEPDCRTCKRSAIQHGVTRCMSPYFCTNADHYEPLPPVRLWRTA